VTCDVSYDYILCTGNLVVIAKKANYKTILGLKRKKYLILTFFI
jgi:hypothetical protein